MLETMSTRRNTCSRRKGVGVVAQGGGGAWRSESASRYTPLGKGRKDPPAQDGGSCAATGMTACLPPAARLETTRKTHPARHSPEQVVALRPALAPKLPGGHSPLHADVVSPEVAPKRPAPQGVHAEEPAGANFPGGHRDATGDVEPTGHSYLPVCHQEHGRLVSDNSILGCAARRGQWLVCALACMRAFVCVWACVHV